MRKRGIVTGLVMMLVGCCLVLPVGAISDEQKAAIKNHCETIRDDLKKVQRILA